MDSGKGMTNYPSLCNEHMHNEFPELDSVYVGLNLWINNILQFALNALEY